MTRANCHSAVRYVRAVKLCVRSRTDALWMITVTDGYRRKPFGTWFPAYRREETSPPLPRVDSPSIAPRSIGSFFMFIIYTPPLTVDVACRCVCYAVRVFAPATESGVISLLSFLLLPLLLAVSARFVGFLCTKRFVMAGSPEKSLLKPPRTESTLVSIRLRFKQKHRPCWSLLFLFTLRFDSPHRLRFIYRM